MDDIQEFMKDELIDAGVKMNTIVHKAIDIKYASENEDVKAIAECLLDVSVIVSNIIQSAWVSIHGMGTEEDGEESQ